jgi:hypothetical protein
MPGESEPPAVVFLREVVACEYAGLMFRHDYRREAAAALAYWERRCRKAELLYSVSDQEERQRQWRSLINGGIRLALARTGRWPADKHILLGPDDPFELPAVDAEHALNSLLMPAASTRKTRRQRAIDERGLPPGVSSEAERLELLRPLAQLVHARLREFGLAA